MERLFKPSLTELEEMQRTPLKMVVVEIVNALGTRVEESLLKQLHTQGTLFSIMAEECTDVTSIEEQTISCCWVESGVPEEHFIEILPLKKANPESIILH